MLQQTQGIQKQDIQQAGIQYLLFSSVIRLNDSKIMGVASYLKLLKK